MVIYLYVKQCGHCDMKYFGYTKTKNPFRYKGSGQYWIRHIKSHNITPITLEVHTFYNQEDATAYAISFSQENDIVESKSWANLVQEDAKPGNVGCKYHTGPRSGLTEESRIKMGLANKGKKRSSDTIKKLSDSHKNRNKTQLEIDRLTSLHKKNVGKKRSTETKEKMRLAQLGKVPSEETKKKISETLKNKHQGKRS